jgi:hypothetical protein
LDGLAKIWIVVVAAALLVVSCGDSDDTPLGSEFIDDLLGSRPGEVLQDSIPVSGSDTVFTYYTTINKQLWLEVGSKRNYERIILLKADFSGADADAQKTVTSADLILTATAGDNDQIDVFFYELGTEYGEDSLIVTVDTTDVIPDPDTGERVRTLQKGNTYALPPELVQGWINDRAHNGIALVYAEALTDTMGFLSREGGDPNSDLAKPPAIRVRFDGGATTTTYAVSDDCVVVRPLEPTDNLVISDGFVRRVFFEIDLSQVNDSAAVHEARVVFKFVPETVFGASQSVELYIPESPDPDSEDFLSGTNVVSEIMDANTGELVLTVTNSILGILAGELENNGFVLKFVSENTDIRQAEFFTSGDPFLGPKLYITYSTPAQFER